MSGDIEAILPLPDFDDQDPQLSSKKMRYQAILDLSKANYESSLKLETDRELDQHKADLAELAATWANEHALDQAIHSAYIEVAKTQITERLNRAEFVQKTAAGISAVYLAILGVTYSVSDGIALPPRGFTPALFLGLAIFLSAVYAAFLTDSGRMDPPSKTQGLGNLGVLQPVRMNTFIQWTIIPVLKRKYMLQVAVTSLGLSVVCLPLPYLAVPDWIGLIVAGIGLISVFLFPVLLERATNKPRKELDKEYNKIMT